MTGDALAAIVADPRLTPDAVRVILHVALLGEGEHAVKGEVLAILLGGGEKPIKAAIHRAEHCGYLEWRFGGRAGHYLTFVGNAAPQGAEKEIAAPAGGKFRENAAPGAGISPLVVGGDGDGTPVVPMPISEQADQALARNDTLLTGCRDSLRDYLGARVQRDKQYPFVQSVVTWLQSVNFRWQLDDGSVIPPAERPGIMAEALNELHATDETDRKFKPGDPANLKTKLGIIIRQRGANRNVRSSGAAGTGTDGRATGRGGQAGAGPGRAGGPVSPRGRYERPRS